MGMTYSETDIKSPVNKRDKEESKIKPLRTWKENVKTIVPDRTCTPHTVMQDASIDARKRFSHLDSMIN